jgi:hypothetical protein
MKAFTFEQFLAKYKSFQKQYNVENTWATGLGSCQAEKLYNYHLRKNSLPKWMK